MKVTACTTKELKSIIHSVGNRIGSVHFIKRSDGTLRKMCFRIGVRTPTYATAPTKLNKEDRERRKQIDNANDQITVFDVNKNNGVVCENGKVVHKRGAWRTIPLNNIKRVKVNGIIYEVEG